MISDWIQLLISLLGIPLFILTAVETRSSTRSELRLRSIVAIGMAAAFLGILWRTVSFVEPHRSTRLLDLVPGVLLLLVLILVIRELRADQKSLLRLLSIGSLILTAIALDVLNATGILR